MWNLAEPLTLSHGTLVCRGTPVGSHTGVDRLVLCTSRVERNFDGEKNGNSILALHFWDQKSYKKAFYMIFMLINTGCCLESSVSSQMWVVSKGGCVARYFILFRMSCFTCQMSLHLVIFFSLNLIFASINNSASFFNKFVNIKS